MKEKKGVFLSARGCSSNGPRPAEQLALDFESVLPPRPELMDLWTPDDILNAALKDGFTILKSFKEDSRVEWKSARYEPRQLSDYFSMWANTQPSGGLIILGLENNGVVSGCLAVGNDRICELENSGAEMCPDARYECNRIAAKRPDGSSDFLLVIRVHYREDRLVETTRMEAYVRSGNRKRRLSEEEKREVRIAKGQISYEKESVDIKFPEDFDDILIDNFCEQYRNKRGLSTTYTREQILVLNHLGSKRGSKFIPNLACSLLFALDPRQITPGARIRVMRFEGIEEKTGQSYNSVKDIYVDGPIPRSIQEAEQVIASQIRNFTRLGNDGKFYTRPEYPADAWLEAVVNAVVHRSYNFKNMLVFVKIFDNRLVVESPGGFPPPVTPENIYDTHNPRNPHLMNALFYLDYVKCAHEGTRRMRDTLKSASLPDPEFAQREIGTHQVHVTLRNNIEARREFVDAAALKIIGENLYEQLNQEEKQIINYMAEKNHINVSDANRLLHKDWQAAKKILESLVSKRIIMRRSTTNKDRDPSARYVFKSRK